MRAALERGEDVNALDGIEGSDLTSLMSAAGQSSEHPFHEKQISVVRLLTLFTFGQKKWQVGGGLLSSRNFPLIMVITMKNIGVLRDTARAPKPISQKHAIPCNGVIRYHKIPYHT